MVSRKRLTALLSTVAVLTVLSASPFCTAHAQDVSKPTDVVNPNWARGPFAPPPSKIPRLRCASTIDNGSLAKLCMDWKYAYTTMQPAINNSFRLRPLILNAA